MAKRQSAFNRALQEAQQRETVTPSNGETVKRQDSETATLEKSDTAKQPNGEAVALEESRTVIRLHSETVKGLEKTSFYITEAQIDKLDDLAHAYKKRTGKRINRNDIVRALIDQADLNTIVAILRS